MDLIVRDRSTPPGTPFHLRSKRDSEDEEEEDEGSVHLDSPLMLEAEAPPAGFASHAIKPDSDGEDEGNCVVMCGCSGTAASLTRKKR